MISYKEAQVLTNYAKTEIKAEAMKLYKLYFAKNIEEQIIKAAKSGQNTAIININMNTFHPDDAVNISADLILDCLIEDCPYFKITKRSSECIWGAEGQPYQRTVEISWE